MIKILQVIGGLNRGGAETMLMNIYRCIDRTQVQFDFLVYSEKKQDYENEIHSLGGKVIRIPSPSFMMPLRSVNNIRKVLEQHGPYTAVHIHTLLNSMFPLLGCLGNQRILRIVHSHNTKNSSSSHVAKRMYEWVALKLIRSLADVWLACGYDAGEYLFGKSFRDKGRVLPNGIPLETFTKDYSQEVLSIKAQLGIKDELVIGSVARLEAVKNHYHMLKVACVLKARGVAFKMLFVGRGSQEDTLKQEAQQLHLNEHIIFLGLRQDIPQLLQLFDVFLMPSLFEGSPVALIEAQASQLPCLISTNIPDDVDLKIGLIRKCALSARCDEWADSLLEHNRNTFTSRIDIEDVFTKFGYNVEKSTEYLQKLYLKHHV